MPLLRVTFKEGEYSKGTRIIGEDGFPIVCVPERAIIIQENRFDKFRKQLEEASIFPIVTRYNKRQRSNPKSP